MNRFRNSSKFRIGDGLAQFEFSLRQNSLVQNTEKINIINLSKNAKTNKSKSEKKYPTKKSMNYNPRASDKADYYNDLLQSIQHEEDIGSNISSDDNNTEQIDQEDETHFEIHLPKSPYQYYPSSPRSKKNSKSKSHSFSKYDHLNNKTSIRRKKNIYNIPTPPLSSFRAPEQLRQLMFSYSQLEYVVRDFLRNNQYYIQFAEKWKYFSDSYDRFIETASLHFSSNFNYNSDSQRTYRQITKATPVYLTSEIIVNNFSEFIQQSKEIQSQSSQFIHTIQKEFEKIHKLIEKTRNSMAQNRYRTDIPCIKIEEFQNNVISLNEELFPKNFLNSYSNNNLNLNKKRLHEQICELNREIFEIFHKYLRYSFINLAIKIQIRTDLSSCVSNIEESLLIAERIGTFVKNLREYVDLTKKELIKVLNLLGFPYHSVLSENDQIRIENKSNDKSPAINNDTITKNDNLISDSSSNSSTLLKLNNNSIEKVGKDDISYENENSVKDDSEAFNENKSVGSDVINNDIRNSVEEDYELKGNGKESINNGIIYGDDEFNGDNESINSNNQISNNGSNGEIEQISNNDSNGEIGQISNNDSNGEIEQISNNESSGKSFLINDNDDLNNYINSIFNDKKIRSNDNESSGQIVYSNDNEISGQIVNSNDIINVAQTASNQNDAEESHSDGEESITDSKDGTSTSHVNDDSSKESELKSDSQDLSHNETGDDKSCEKVEYDQSNEKVDDSLVQSENESSNNSESNDDNESSEPISNNDDLNNYINSIFKGKKSNNNNESCGQIVSNNDLNNYINSIISGAQAAGNQNETEESTGNNETALNDSIQNNDNVEKEPEMKGSNSIASDNGFIDNDFDSLNNENISDVESNDKESVEGDKEVLDRDNDFNYYSDTNNDKEQP